MGNEAEPRRYGRVRRRPSALARLESTVSILPSEESFTVEVEIVLPLVFSIISQVLASTVFHAAVEPNANVIHREERIGIQALRQGGIADVLIAGGRRTW